MDFKPEQLQAYFIMGTQDLQPEQDFLTILKTALAAGITAFQFREKGPTALTGADKLALAQTCRQLTQAYQVPLIIDDDIELALAVHADGLHVGQKDEGIEATLAQVQQRLFVGYSCSTVAEVEHANQLDQIAYLGSGPIYPTGSKADADPVIGLAGLEKLVHLSRCPIVAIGGITAAHLNDIAATGAAGVSVISMITQSKDITGSVQAMRQAFGSEATHG